MHAASLEQLEEEYSSPYVYSHDMYYMLYNQIDSIYMSYNILYLCIVIYIHIHTHTHMIAYNAYIYIYDVGLTTIC